MDTFNKTEYGKVALKKLNNPENFYIYECEIIGEGEASLLKCTGAQFRPAKKGKNKGEYTVMIPGTMKITYVHKSEY